MKFIIVGILLIILGICMIIWPKFFWLIEYGIYTKGGEPTDLAIFLERFSGIILTIGGITVIVLEMIN